MNIRKIYLFMIILLFVSVATVFANPKEGYYHNSREECISIMHLGNSTYYVVWFDRIGRQDYRFDTRLVGNRLLYTVGGSNHYIELRNNRNIIVDSRWGEFTWSYSL